MFARIGQRKTHVLTNTLTKRKSFRRHTLRKERNSDGIPGLYQLRISKSLQSILSCRIGINITDNERWTYIDKRLLMKEIKKRQATKGLALSKIVGKIEIYPEEKILIGSYGSDTFFICLSEYATDVCENWKAEEKRKLLEYLLKCLHKSANKWITLGSHSELVTYSRDPFITEIDLRPRKVANFTFRLVADVRDGYVELLTSRHHFNVIYRKRKNESCQCAKMKAEKYTQTIGSHLVNRCLQYRFSYPVTKKNDSSFNYLKKWFTLNYCDLSDLIHTNQMINFYHNDYYELPNQRKRYSFENPNLLISFYDSMICHGKVVTCITWNAHMTGVIAAAYSRVCPKMVIHDPSKTNRNVATDDTYLAIIWNAAQPYRPLAYLHAYREITSLKFCPFDPNIIVGGLANGQIVVWDLRGKLDRQKRERIVNPEVEVLIESSMAWMKYPPNIKNIFPSVESKFETSHRSQVTEIQWIPPEYYLNRQGEFVQDHSEHMQFLTTSLNDSTMLVWDLKPTIFLDESKKKPTVNHKVPRPGALDAKKSPFAYLNVNFKPILQFDFMENDSKMPIHISNFSFMMGQFAYRLLEKKSVRKFMFFVRDKHMEQLKVEKKFVATTDLGHLHNCSWMARDYDLGMDVNRQKVDSVQCSIYHDGPICHLQRSPFSANLVLTTGGRVFAIWDTGRGDTKKPIMWRKCTIRYVMACWSRHNSTSVIAAREDGKIELWDFDEENKAPLRMTKFLGENLLSVFVNNSFQHVWQNTCIATDRSGTISVYNKPTTLYVDNKKTKFNSYIQNIYNRRSIIEYLVNSIQKQNEENKEDIDEFADEDERRKRRISFTTEITRISIMAKKPTVNMWQEKEFKRMYKILIDKNKRNLKNVDKEQEPCEEEMKKRYARLRKIEGFIANKKKVFIKERQKITRVDPTSSGKQKLTVAFPKELSQLLKEQFYENYKTTEVEVSNYIQSNRYRYYFDWSMMLVEAKRRYKGIISKTAEYSTRDFQLQKLFSVLPRDVGGKSTKLLMTEIALVTSVSGK